MQRIIAPLRPGDRNDAVASLQDALRLLVERGRITLDPAERDSLLGALGREREEQAYANATRRLVVLFRVQHSLNDLDSVDDETAAALNGLLRELGALDDDRPVSERMVAGQVVNATRQPLLGIAVTAVHEDGARAIRLGEDNTDAEGRYAIRYEMPPGVRTINLRVAAFDAGGVLLKQAEIIQDATPLETVNLILDIISPPTYRVDGKVSSRASAGVGGLRVMIVGKGVGGDVQLAEVVTDDGGAYHATFSDTDLQRRGKTQPDLQARVFAGDTFLGASDVHYNASQHETLNVLLEDKATSALRSEYEVLTSALASQFKGKLGDLKETDGQQDITYLANKTGWDARAVALAALADQFSARTADASGAPAIPQAFFYALFRAGLPTTEDTLYQTDAKTLGAVWKKASEQGVIPKSSTDQISDLIGRFHSLSVQKLQTSPPLMGVSSLIEMLTVSGLNDPQRAQFAQLYAAHGADMPIFWKEVAEAFGQEVTARLQVDGKLGFLTINNAPLMQKIHTTVGASGVSDPLQLARMGYHRPEQWTQLLSADIPIPKEISGDTPESKRANYAHYLAAQLRLSYPTAAVVQMLQSGELPLTGAADGTSNKVQAFLAEHQGKFEISVQPVEQYIAQHNVQVADATIQQIKRLQRVYQITPSDQAMIGLMKRGIDAAYHVVRYDRDAFVQSFAADLGGADAAALTYDRSVQVHNAVLNVALSYLSARTAPGIGVHSPASVLDPTPANAGDVVAYTTLETLFNSMDFCPCEHCRSLLSPAAYLVDLLMFLDQQDVPTGTNPQTVLLERRPDIQYLPLTCQNTNTALPYIDLVNETLEYYVANRLTLQKNTLDEYHGHDTNGIASEDLLANPQFATEAAYTTLRNEDFPAPLPFQQPLENLRRYFNKFEVPLPLAMERLRKSDVLDVDRTSSPPPPLADYGWRDILMEEVGLSRAEYEILTDSGAVPLWRMYGFPSGTLDANVAADLSNAKQFARRLEISYEELVSLLKTRFINPNSDLIPKLERLGVSFAVLAELKTNNNAATDSKFDALLAALAVPPDPAEYGGDIKAWIKNQANYNRIMGLITLAIPAGTWIASKAYGVGDFVRPTAAQSESTLYYECTKPGTSGATEPKWPTTPRDTYKDGPVEWTCRDASSCLSFDHLAFRYSDPATIAQDIGAVEFVRLLRFIRLWKKLGWTIEQTDAAICALYRGDLAPLDATDIDGATKLDIGFKTLLPRLGILIRVMKALNLTPERDLLALLACWSEIGTHGDTAFYQQLFLSPALLKQDPTFNDNLYGEFLSDNTQKLADHAEALRSAFNLTVDEYERIVAALGYSANTPLTIANISAIFRGGWLARKLKLSVRELLLFIQLTGLDPFAAPSLTSPAILRLTELVQAMRDRSFKSAAALYLVWNQDLSGKSAPDPAQITKAARALRADFVSIDDQFAAIEDPNGDVARVRMALVYGQETSDTFFALLDDTLVVDVAYTHPATALESAITAVDGKIAYDDFRHRLSHTGLLSMGTRNNLKGITGVTGAFQNAVDALFDRGEQMKGLFFTRYPELKQAYDSAIVIPPADRHSAFLALFQPELARRRKRQQALQRLSAAAGVDLVFEQVLLDPPSGPYPFHASGDQNKPALDDLLALETRGLAAKFFFRATATGNVDQSISAAANLTYSSGGSNPLPNPGNAISGIWSGQVEAPEAGFYNFIIEADSGATATLTLDGQALALTQNGNVRRNTDPRELRAGMLYQIELKVENVKDALSLKWETPKRAQEVIPSRYLYPPSVLVQFSSVYLRFLKAASLATGLALTGNELAYFATHADYRINVQGQIDSSGEGWLNVLPNVDNLHLANPADAALAKNVNAALLVPLRALLDFARIKADISPGDESLLTTLKDPTVATQNTDSLLFTIARWNQPSLNDVLAQFSSNIAGLGHFDLFRRVYDAFVLIQKMGISAKALIQATTNEPTSRTVRDVQSALRARYDVASWRDVVRPISDQMRSLQRDALVAYILHQMRSNPASAHIDTADKLFEYFLMDVQMDPCMQTSRIRHALSSVQLFIERCLMNLERHVSPAAINNAKQWAWMKRYRVWEANRKVYLFPENWLEPELRDDKSPFFKELERELLQSDITEERAATALLNYLSKLEEVAKLEPCGIYHIPADSSKRTGEINHVVARTAGARRKYYYRRYEYGYWTPWEQIRVDIEDNPVVPYVWNGRLLLFWLRILKQTPDAALQMPSDTKLQSGMTISSVAKPEATNVSVGAVLCWSEYYNGKWQPTKTSDIEHPLDLGQFAPAGQSAFDRSRVILSIGEEEKALRIDVIGQQTFKSFLLYNTHSLPVPGIAPLSIGERARSLENVDGKSFDIEYSLGGMHLPFEQHILDLRAPALPFSTLAPTHKLSDPWDAPFFFQDSLHVFYVTTEERQVPIKDRSDYGVRVNLGSSGDVSIAPVVFPLDSTVKTRPEFGKVPSGVSPDGVDPVAIRRFITEDAYIHRGLATVGSVMYGGSQIGPAGKIADVGTRR